MTDKIDVLRLSYEADEGDEEAIFTDTEEWLNRYTALVMEECAKVADDMLASHATDCKEECDYVIAWQDVAAAIRERKP